MIELESIHRSKKGNFTDYIFNGADVKVTVDEKTNSITINLTTVDQDIIMEAIAQTIRR